MRFESIFQVPMVANINCFSSIASELDELEAICSGVIPKIIYVQISIRGFVSLG